MRDVLNEAAFGGHQPSQQRGRRPHVPGQDDADAGASARSRGLALREPPPPSAPAGARACRGRVLSLCGPASYAERAMRRFQAGMFLALAVIFVGIGAAATPRHGPTLRIVTLGSGRVACANGCSGAHRRGEVLRLTAKPAANYVFERWSGGCIGLVPTCPVALDRSATVRAGFVGRPSELVVAVGGPGKVTSIPSGLDCGGGGYICTLVVPFGSEVTLRPDLGRRRSLRRLGRAVRVGRLRRLHAPDRRCPDRDRRRLRPQLAAARRATAHGRQIRLVGARDEPAGGDRLSAHVHGAVRLGNGRDPAPEHGHVAAGMHGGGSRSVRDRH